MMTSDLTSKVTEDLILVIGGCGKEKVSFWPNEARYGDVMKCKNLPCIYKWLGESDARGYVGR